MIIARLRVPLAVVALAMVLAQLVLNAGCATAPTERPAAEVQAVDDLLGLIKTRLELAAESAHESPDGAHGNAAKSGEIVDAAVNRAFEYSLPPELVHEFFSAQFTAASHVQTVVRSSSKPSPRANPAESNRVKPRVEPASAPLLAALSKAYPILRSPGGKDLLIRRAEQLFTGIPGGAQTTVLALRPLSSVAN